MKPRRPTSPEGERLYQLRTAADITQEQLAELTGVHFTTWSRFESGARSRPRSAHLMLFVKALNLGDDVLAELLELREQEYDNNPPQRKVTMAAERLEQFTERIPQVRFVAPPSRTGE